MVRDSRGSAEARAEVIPSTRIAFAMMVRAGFTAELEAKKLPSTT